jgi:hypothetical protein
MTFETMKFTNFNQLRKYSNFSENDNDKKLALKSNLGKLLKCDMDLIEKVSPRKNKQLKMLDDIEEEENNKKFYDNFLNNLYSNEKRFKTKSNKKNKKEYNFFPFHKNSAKLLSFNKFNLAASVINSNSKYDSNNNINYYKNSNNNYNINNFNIKLNKINDNDENDIKNEEKENKKYLKRNSCFMPNTFEKQLEIEEIEREKKEKKRGEEEKYEIKEDKNIYENDKDSSFNSSKKNSSSYILKQTENQNKLKFLNKEITYFKNDDNKDSKKNVNTLLDKRYSDIEEKKNSTIKSENGYVINDKIDKKKKFCFCCIPII